MSDFIHVTYGVPLSTWLLFSDGWGRGENQKPCSSIEELQQLIEAWEQLNPNYQNWREDSTVPTPLLVRTFLSPKDSKVRVTIYTPLALLELLSTKKE